MKVAVLGYGAIGKKRVDALWKLREKYNIKDILIYDPFVENLHIYNELESIERQSPEWVIVATPNDVAVDLVKKVSFSRAGGDYFAVVFATTENKVRDNVTCFLVDKDI